MTAAPLTQPSHNTTLMGVIHAVARHLDLKVSDPWLYGVSGHAFVINIHEAICPSGPYCWHLDPFVEMLRNAGIEQVGHGYFGEQSTPETSGKR